MSVPKNERIELFVVVKGHAFSRDAFEAMLRAVGCEPTFVDQPAAAALLNPEQMRRYDAILFYDMPGLDFRTRLDQRPGFVEPDLALRAGFEALLAEGKGIVALHHAIAGWPAWPAYAQALGGLFLYRGAKILGQQRSSSGYVGDRAYTARRVAVAHPVLDGIPERFDLVDELYLFEVFDDPGIQPLIYLDSDVPPSSFQSAERAIRRIGENEGDPWTPPSRNRMLGWAKAAGKSPLVYLQPGDSPATYADPVYRKLIGNAVRWVASDSGREWAATMKA